MSAQDDRRKAMLWQRPERIPIGAGMLPAAWMKHREKIEAIAVRHPLVFGA